MNLKELYQEIILDHGKNPRNLRKAENFNKDAKGYNPLCGDKVHIFLKLDENKKIQDISFEGSGCAISMASASIMTELLKKFLNGMHDPEIIEEQYLNIYSNAIVHGLEEALEGPYKKAGLDILKIESWPAEKINWVPKELRGSVGHALTKKFASFKKNLERKLTLDPI